MVQRDLGKYKKDDQLDATKFNSRITFIFFLKLNLPLIIQNTVQRLLPFRFIEQLKRDVKFLKEFNLMDYSLLLGIQTLSGSSQNALDRGSNTPTFADLVYRVKRYIFFK